MCSIRPPLVVLLALASLAGPAGAQAEWSLSTGVGLSHLTDQLNGPALGSLAVRARLLRETRVAWGLEVSHHDFGRAAAAGLCADEGCTHYRYEGSSESSALEVHGVARFGGRTASSPYLIATLGYAATSTRREYNGVREESLRGIGGSAGLGILPLRLGRRVNIGLEGRIHGLVVADDDGGEGSVGIGKYFTLLGMLRLDLGGARD